MKLAIIGSRTFQDKNRLYFEINEFRKTNKVTEIISGGAKGADIFGENYADDFNIKKSIFKVNWKDMTPPCIRRTNSYGEYNSLAGINRNILIINACDIVFAFWDGKSPGTNDSIQKAKNQGKEVKIFNFS